MCLYVNSKGYKGICILFSVKLFWHNVSLYKHVYHGIDHKVILTSGTDDYLEIIILAINILCNIPVCVCERK